MALCENISIKGNKLTVFKGLKPVMWIKVENEKSIFTDNNQLNKVDDLLEEYYGVKLFNYASNSAQHRYLSFMERNKQDKKLMEKARKTFFKNFRVYMDNKVISFDDFEEIYNEFIKLSGVNSKQIKKDNNELEL
jgi:hypothetical protein